MLRGHLLARQFFSYLWGRFCFLGVLKHEELKMMNFLALSLVLSSLAAAGVWSPTPEKRHINKEDVIVKEGHRVIVVETYDEHGQHNTKVSISPPFDQHQKQDVLDSAKDMIKEASSVLPNLGQGISHEGEPSGGKQQQGSTGTPGELICDAYGKCTHKLASAIGKVSDKVSETAKEAKEKVSQTVHQVGAKQKDLIQKEAAAKKQMAHDAKETAAQIAQDIKDGAKKSVDKAKDTVNSAKETGKTISADIAGNVSETMEHAREKAADTVEELKEGTEHAAEMAKTGAANRLLNMFWHMGLPQTFDKLMGVMNLMGFATAYGMSVWVSFVSSYVLAGALPRQQFALVQSKIYPVYFRAMASSIGLALLGHVLWQRKKLFSSEAEMFQACNLLASILMVLANALYLEPKATKVMFERMRMEKEEGRGRESFTAESSRSTERQAAGTDPMAAAFEAPLPSPSSTPSPSLVARNQEQEAVRIRMARLSEKLKNLNSNSSFLNILTLLALTWHLVYLGQRLALTC